MQHRAAGELCGAIEVGFALVPAAGEGERAWPRPNSAAARNTGTSSRSAIPISSFASAMAASTSTKHRAEQPCIRITRPIQGLAASTAILAPVPASSTDSSLRPAVRASHTSA